MSIRVVRLRRPSSELPVAGKLVSDVKPVMYLITDSVTRRGGIEGEEGVQLGMGAGTGTERGGCAGKKVP